jgi:hypothetical protein
MKVFALLLALASVHVVPMSIERRLPVETSPRDFMDCVCCLPPGGQVTAQSLTPSERQQVQQFVQQLVQQRQPVQQRQAAPQQPSLTPAPQQPVPQRQPDVVQPPQSLTTEGAIRQEQAMLPPTILAGSPILLASARSSGCGYGGSNYYYHTRRLGLRRR